MLVTTKKTTAEAKSVNKDFELIVISKMNNQLFAKLLFDYLGQHFECDLKISTSSIQIKSKYPFAGIVSETPIVPSYDITKYHYLHHDETISQKGNEHIIWLMLDVIHLYNLIRLKPKSILNLYKDVFDSFKIDNPLSTFGYIDTDDEHIINIASQLSTQLKNKHKHAYSCPKSLLISFQNLLNQYPKEFTKPEMMH